ncbi:type VI secretion system tube protein Hcp [Bradyrhizobium sp. LjRoot220]
MAHEDEDPALTYLVKIGGIEGTSQLDGYTGYFEVDAFTFGELTTLASSGGGGGGSGKAVFDPLMVDLDGVSPGLTSLLGNAADGRHIETVDLVGLKITDGHTSEVYHLQLDDATVSGIAIDGHDTAVAFNFTQVTETIREQNPDGSLDAGQTFSFDLGREGGSINPVDHDALAAMVHAHHDVLLV